MLSEYTLTLEDVAILTGNDVLILVLVEYAL